MRGLRSEFMSEVIWELVIQSIESKPGYSHMLSLVTGGGPE